MKGMSLRTDGKLIGAPSTRCKATALWEISRRQLGQLGINPLGQKPTSTELVRSIGIQVSNDHSFDVHIERY